MGRTQTTHSKHTHTSTSIHSFEQRHTPVKACHSGCLIDWHSFFSQAGRQAGPVTEQIGKGWGHLPPSKAKCGINQTRPRPLTLWPTDRRLIWAGAKGVEGKASQLIHQPVRNKAGTGEGDKRRTDRERVMLSEACDLHRERAWR